MTPAQRLEARVALAMLPVGVLVLVASAIAFAAVALLAVAALVERDPWRGGWAVLAAAVAAHNALKGVAITAAFDWRPLPLVLLLSAAIAAAWPGWWLD